MKDKARSFRFNSGTNVYLKEVASKFNVTETKILETLVLMIHSDVIPDHCNRWKHENYINVEDFEWFLKN